MSRKIPDDAFDQYVSLGPKRSYQAIAERYGVSKRSVTKLAHREDWKGRLLRIERMAREKGDEHLAGTLEDMRLRHLKAIRALQGRAVAALRQYPLTSGMEASRALEAGIKLERLVAGEVNEPVNLEEIARRELDRWMKRTPDAPDEPPP